MIQMDLLFSISQSAKVQFATIGYYHPKNVQRILLFVTNLYIEL